jgi:hypothetical protein
VIVRFSVIESDSDGVVENENVWDVLGAGEEEFVATMDLVVVPVNDAVLVAVWVASCDSDAVPECDIVKVDELV